MAEHHHAASGEQMERARSRRRRTIFGALFVAGLFSGAYIGWTIAAQDFDLSQPWPPTACLVIAALYSIAMTWGSIALSRNIDEVERQVHAKAATVAGSAYVVVYPLWFILWKGGFVIEPIHWALFILFWVALAASTLYYRYR